MSPAISPSLPLPLHEDKPSRKIRSYSHTWKLTPRPHSTDRNTPLHAPALSALKADTNVLLGDLDTAFQRVPFLPHSQRLTASSVRPHIALLERSWVEKKLQLNEGHLTVNLNSKEKQIFITSIQSFLFRDSHPLEWICVCVCVCGFFFSRTSFLINSEA